MPRQHAKGRGSPAPRSRGAAPTHREAPSSRPATGAREAAPLVPDTAPTNDEAPEAPDRLEPDPQPRMAPDSAATDMERADERKGGSLQSPPHPDPADAVPGFLEAGDRDAGARLP